MNAGLIPLEALNSNEFWKKVEYAQHLLNNGYSKFDQIKNEVKKHTKENFEDVNIKVLQLINQTNHLTEAKKDLHEMVGAIGNAFLLHVDKTHSLDSLESSRQDDVNSQKKQINKETFTFLDDNNNTNQLVFNETTIIEGLIACKDNLEFSSTLALEYITLYLAGDISLDALIKSEVCVNSNH